MTRPSYSSAGATIVLGLKKITKKAPRVTKKNYCLKNFQFLQNDYNLAENTEFLAWLIFSSSANFGLLMTNDGALNRDTKESLFWGI